jgi:Flp pilus assembly protein TadG
MLSRNTHPTSRARRGAAAVESAVVMGVFLLFLFGVFEYCRFLMVLHVTNNAARDAARYAAVNANCDPDPVIVANKKADILAYTKVRMGGTDQNIVGYQVAVYPCSAAGFTMSPPQAVPKSLSSTTPADPFSDTDPNNPPWNAATFSERIAVTVRGTYRPITPVLLLMPSDIPINVTAVTGSEG